MKLFLLVGSAAIALTSVAADVVDVKVKALDGFGGDTSSVLSRCQTKVGKRYDSVMVTRDVNTLKDSGEFETIDANAQATASGDYEVVFYVKRKYRYVAPLVVKGNDFFSESKVSNEAELKDGFLYGEADLAAAAARVRLAYQKKYFLDAKGTPLAEVTGGNNATVTLVIDEGRRQKVDEFVFRGTAHAVDVSYWKSILPGWTLAEEDIDVAEIRTAIDDYPWWNPVGWFSDGPVTKDQQAQCCEKIAKGFRDHGYLDVTVTGPAREPTDDEHVNVVFDVNEGPQYRIGDMSIKGLTKYPEGVVREKSEFPEAGTIAGEQALEDVAHRIKVTVGSVPHPMTPGHHISFIFLETEHGGQMKILMPDDAPEAVFNISEDKPVAVYEYCNIHGLWKTDFQDVCVKKADCK